MHYDTIVMNSNKEKGTFFWKKCTKYLAFTEIREDFSEEDMIEIIIEE